MDRFSWTDGLLAQDEQLILQQNGIKLYDGEDDTSCDHGKLILTTHRLLWRDHRNQEYVIALNLSFIVLCEETPQSFSKSAKIICHLSTVAHADKSHSPVTKSRHNYVRFSFREGGQKQFMSRLQECLRNRPWEQKSTTTMFPKSAGATKRAGIVGIERKMQQKHKETDQHISESFTDLRNLMDKAKEMVTLSKTISDKIKEKQGDITEDETIRFKSYLLSLGIDDPVTRESHGTGNKYYRELARQISSIMEKPLQDCGGIMTLTDVYCRVNRARGMELLSPDDLMQACRLMAGLQLPVRLQVFESGVMVLQLQALNVKEVVKLTEAAVVEQGSLTAEELSQSIGLSVVLCKERLLSTEKAGRVCRDESVQGLRFYPNLFLSQNVT